MYQYNIQVLIFSRRSQDHFRRSSIVLKVICMLPCSRIYSVKWEDFGNISYLFVSTEIRLFACLRTAFSVDVGKRLERLKMLELRKWAWFEAAATAETKFKKMTRYGILVGERGNIAVKMKNGRKKCLARREECGRSDMQQPSALAERMIAP